MECQIHTLNPQLVYKRTVSRSKQLPAIFSSQPTFKVPSTTLFSSHNNLNEQQLVSTTTVKHTQVLTFDVCNVEFESLGDCKLGISRYPDFEYNAQGGAGSGTATADLDGEIYVDFDVKELYVPPLSTATTKFLGLPLPPFLRIDIVPEAFNGKINQESGKVELKFKARFCFSFGTIYRAAPLLVETVLTTEETKGKMRRGRGERLNEDGMCRLVGVATVEPINDLFMDTFLSLPTECLANLNAIISFSSNS